MILAKGWRLLRRRGLRYVWYLMTGYLFPRVLDWVLDHQPTSLRKRALLPIGTGVLVLILAAPPRYGTAPEVLALLLLYLAAVLVGWGAARMKMLRHLREARAITLETRCAAPDRFTAWTDLPIDPQVRESIDAMRRAQPDDDIRIGRIDNDGRVLGVFGAVGRTHSVTEAAFVERYRFPLDIVVKDDKVLVRKDFRRNRIGFIREWYNLAILQEKANVPTVYEADETRCILYKNFVLGQTIRDVLVAAGARILNVQTDSDPALAPLSGKSRLEAIARRGTRLVPSSLSEGFLRELEHQMEAIHKSGVAGLSLTFGNIIVRSATGDPWLLDFEGARHFGSTLGFLYSLKRDQDRQALNRLYGRDLITKRTARSHLADHVAKAAIRYAPIDFGGGLTAGRFWSTENGTGRWDFLNQNVVAPLVAQKRVLDLGSHNGAMPMMMLRSGAREVVALEVSPSFAETAHLVHRIFEWRDMRSYALQIRNCNMLELMNNGWGIFDVVTAFSSLYYLGPEDMARLVRKISTIAPIIVIQGNRHTRRDAADDKAVKSSLPFLRKLLEDNGFSQVDIHAPRDYARPLLVGRSHQQD